jgi:hypothetical protein
VKYEPRKPNWENTWTKIIINMHSFNIKPHKTLIGKAWENISLPPFYVSRKRFGSVTNPS